MPESNDEPVAGLVDLRDVSLSELRRRNDSPFVRALDRIVAENEDPEALTVVAFQSII